jgi:hypothetical protein
MPKLTFLELAEKYSEKKTSHFPQPKSGQRLSRRNTIKALGGSGKTPANTLYSAIFTNTRDHPDTIFVKLANDLLAIFSKSY